MEGHSNRARLIVVGSMVRVKHAFSAAMGYTARLSWHFRAGADAKAGTHQRKNFMDAGEQQGPGVAA